MTREDRAVSIGRRNPRGYGEGQPDAEAPTERLTLPEQGAGAQDPTIQSTVSDQATASDQATRSESVGIRVNKPLITRRPDERWTRKEPANGTPERGEGARSTDGANDATRAVDAALAAQLTERITPGSSPDATTAAFATPEDPTIATPSLDSTRVGSPDPEDPVQRGVRAVRCSRWALSSAPATSWSPSRSPTRCSSRCSRPKRARRSRFIC